MFIVVLSTLVVNTVTAKGPIIFMKLAQEESGEIDAVLQPGGKSTNSNSYWNDIISMNYTLAMDLLKENDVEHYISPRY